MSAAPNAQGQAPTGPGESGLPISPALRILMGVGFLAVGIVQGVGILTGEAVVGTNAMLDGLAFFLMAGTGATMLMDRAYSLYLLLVWAVVGIVSSLMGDGTPVVAALIARIMVGLVAVVALSQRGAHHSTLQS